MATIFFENGKTYEALSAGLSIFTGEFVTAVKTDNIVELLSNFQSAEVFYAETIPEGRQEYSGYKKLIRLTFVDEYYYIVLAKEGDS